MCCMIRRSSRHIWANKEERNIWQCLEVKDLEVYYGVIQALKGISFDVDQGDIVALIGANGAGKTTTLHTITGLLNAKAGKIIYEGKDITHIPGYKLVKYGNCPCAGGTACICDPFCSAEPDDGRLYPQG